MDDDFSELIADLAVGQAETPHQIWSKFSEEQKGLANRILNKLPWQGVLSSHSDLLDNEYEFMLEHKTFWAGDMSDLSGLESELQKLGYFTIGIRSTATNGQIAKGECHIFFVDNKLEPKTGTVPAGVKLKFQGRPASTTNYEPDEPVGILRRPVDMAGQDRALLLGDSFAAHLVSRVTEAEAENNPATYKKKCNGRRENHQEFDAYSIFHSYKPYPDPGSRNSRNEPGFPD